ncbi:MAG: MalM family protein [Chromatiales bacterium]|jgi:hypothetical protein
MKNLLCFALVAALSGCVASPVRESAEAGVSVPLEYSELEYTLLVSATENDIRIDERSQVAECDGGPSRAAAFLLPKAVDSTVEIKSYIRGGKLFFPVLMFLNRQKALARVVQPYTNFQGGSFFLEPMWQHSFTPVKAGEHYLVVCTNPNFIGKYDSDSVEKVNIGVFGVAPVFTGTRHDQEGALLVEYGNLSVIVE